MTIPTPITIAVRAWTERLAAESDSSSSRKRAANQSNATHAKWPRNVLIIDTETTTDATQALKFGSYRYCRWTSSSHLECVEEAFFYAENLPERDPEGFAQLQAYAAANSAAVTGSRKLALLTRREFLNRVFWPAADSGRALIVGFNLPFDLSRLASAWGEGRGPYWKGFSLVLAEYKDKSGIWQENRYKPRVCYKPKDSKRAFIGFHGGRDRRGKHYGNFLDLKTLAFALTTKSLSLESACREFGVENGKVAIGDHGVITSAYIDYNRRDVLASQELLERMRAELDLHPIELNPCKAYSSASIAKAYQRALGFTPMRQKFADIPLELQTASLNAYFGGRSENRIRKQEVPVVYTDFLSMYPTVNVLMDLSAISRAERLKVVDCTDDVRRMLEEISVERCFDPTFWKELRFFGLIEPTSDILPVRARYDDADDNWTIGLNRFTSETPMWYSGPDLVASALLSGQAPRVLRAMRMIPRGTQEGLKAIKLRGSVSIDPNCEDFFRVVIERRQIAKRNRELSKEESAKLDQFLKLLANSGSYGIFAEFNRKEMRAGKRSKLRVHGLNGAFECYSDAPEDPGTFTFPPVAALITGGARLMLALLERCVVEAGGTYAFCDTDSMAIVSTESGGTVPGQRNCPEIPVLSWSTVSGIVERFRRLNPYDRNAVPSSILKIEDENFRGDERARLYCYMISAKRYALYNRNPDGAIVLRKRTEHGLGHLMNPTDPNSEDSEWISSVWELLISQELGLPTPIPEWLSRPAISRLSVTTAEQLHRLTKRGTRDGYANQIKPANFILSAHLQPFGHPDGYTGLQFHLVSPYERDARKWLRMRWTDIHSGKRFVITTGDNGSVSAARVKSYADVVREFQHHPEPKSADFSGNPCSRETIGLLSRRHLQAAEILYIGKESNQLEEVEAGRVSDWRLVTEIYSSQSSKWTQIVLPLLRTRKRTEIAQLLRVSERAVSRWRNGHAKPSLARQAILFSQSRLERH